MNTKNDVSTESGQLHKSASLHTGKRKIPRAVYLLALCALVVPLLFWFAFSKVTSRALPAAPDVPGIKPAVLTAGDAGASPISRISYFEARTPRLEGLPQTAPIYDRVTEPVTAPYPAACVHASSGGDCKCYSQQATRIHVSQDLCREIVAKGYFLDFETPEHVRAREALQQQQQDAKDRRQRAREQADQAKRDAVAVRPMPQALGDKQNEITQADIPQALGLRNPALRGTRDGGYTVSNAPG